MTKRHTSFDPSSFAFTSHHGIDSFAFRVRVGELIRIGTRVDQYQRECHAALLVAGADHAFDRWHLPSFELSFGFTRRDDGSAGFIAFGVAVSHMRDEDIGAMDAAMRLAKRLHVMIEFDAFASAIAESVSPRMLVTANRDGSTEFGTKGKPMSAKELSEAIRASCEAKSALARSYFAPAVDSVAA